MKYAKFLKEVDLIVQLALHRIPNDYLVVLFVNNCEMGCRCAENGGRARLVCHESEFSEGLTRPEPGHFLSVGDFYGTKLFPTEELVNSARNVELFLGHP